MKSLDVDRRYFFRVLLAFALVLSPVLFLLAQSQAGTFFGPEVFMRDSGKPVTVMREIITDGFEAPFILHLQNGDDNGENRVSSAKVILNGAMLLGPPDFSQQVSGHYVQVELENPSTLEVRLASAPGSTLTIWIEGTPINPNARIVGPEGGRFVFPNGVILDIPPGAVTKTTAISVTDLPCESVDVILSAQEYKSYEKRCVVGFSAEPDVVFNVPIKAIVPILPLEPNEIPLLMEIDFDELKYWITKTDITVLPDQQVAEIVIPHFSYIVVGAIDGIDPKKLDELCTDPAFNQILQICEDFDDLQPAACLLKKEDRPPGTICCREAAFTAKAEAIDFSINKSSGECEILLDNVEVTYHECTLPDGSSASPQTHSMGEISPNCPEGMTFEIDVKPSLLNMFVCEEKDLIATITGKTADGTALFQDVEFPPVWRDVTPNVVAISPGGTVKGISEGNTRVKALASVNSQIPPGEAVVYVESNIRSFTVDPSHVELKVNEVGILNAIVLDRFGDLLNASAVKWWSDNPAVADVAVTTGPLTFVSGVDKGSTTVMAEYTYDDCETKQAMADVTVECPKVQLTVDPPNVTILPGGQRTLDAIVLDEFDNPLDASAVTWSSGSPSVQLSTTTGPQTTVEGIAPSTVPVAVTATYDEDVDDGCETEETVFVTVVCADLAVTPSLGAVEVDAFLPLSVEALDSHGNPVDVDLSGVTWTSSDANTAAVIPSEGPLTIAVGIKPGTAEITASSNQGVCGIKTDSATISVYLEYCAEPHDVYDEETSSTIRIIYENWSGYQEILVEYPLWTVDPENGVAEFESLESRCDANGKLHVVYMVEYFLGGRLDETWHMYSGESGWTSELLNYWYYDDDGNLITIEP